MKVQQLIECAGCKWRVIMTGSNGLKKLGGPPSWDMASLKAHHAMMNGVTGECRFCGVTPTKHPVHEVESDSESVMESAAASENESAVE